MGNRRKKRKGTMRGKDEGEEKWEKIRRERKGGEARKKKESRKRGR